jgi:hypothetical protein
LKVVFVGATQALRLQLAYSNRVNATDAAIWMPDHAVGTTDKAEALDAADKIVRVGAGRPPDFAVLALKAELIVLPELQLDFLWPFAGQPHIANAPDDLYPDGPFSAELGDAWLNRALEGPSRAEAIERAYLALDVARIVDLDRMKDLALEAQAERDKIIGVDFATRIAQNFRHRPVFASPRAPGPEMFGLFAAAVFARLGLAYAGETAPTMGRDLPIHPSVAAHFGLAETPPCAQGWGEAVDFAEYVRRYLAYAEGSELEGGLALMAAERFEEAAHALEIAAARPMGRRCRSAQRGFALANLRAAGVEGEEVAADLVDPDYSTSLAAFARGRWSEAERALLAYLMRASASAGDFERLADIREKLGNADGAFAALELAVGLKPDDRGLAARLTLALATRGDILGAVRAAERQIALEPADPHPRAFLVFLLIRAGWTSRAAQEADRALAVIGDDLELADLRDALRARRAELGG